MEEFFKADQTVALSDSGLNLEWLDSAKQASAERQANKIQDPPKDKQNDGKDSDHLDFEYVPVGRILVLSSITLPDGGKVSRVTEPLPGRDGESGARRLAGYKLPDGTLLDREIRRNSDGTMSILDLNPDGTKTDRHEQRMSNSEFIQYVKENQNK